MALIEGIAALVAKVASASTVAQATAGLGIAVAGVTGAGAAGVLPGPVQDTVAGAVEAVTPFELPHSRGDHGPAQEQPATDDRQDDGPGTLPAPTVVVPTPAVPTGSAEQETEAEHGVESADGTHQHRGGRSDAPVATDDASDDSAETAEAPEVEDDHDAGDSSGRGGEDTDGSGDSGGDDSDGGSGHGGDD